MKALERAVRLIPRAFALAIAFGGMAPPAQAIEPAGLTDLAPRNILVMLRLSPDHHRPGSAYGGDYGDQLSNRVRLRRAQQIARRHGLELVGDGWPMPVLGIDCFVMRIPEARQVEATVAEISRDPLVAWSQPVQTFKTKGGPDRVNDPLFPVQPAARAWRLADLYKVSTGRGVVVAVVDSRVDVNHPDLAGQFVASKDFVSDRAVAPELHGTGVAGIIAAKAGNGIGIAGVAPDAKLMALRACWQTGSANGDAASTMCDSLSLAKALQFAIEHGATVINLSLAGPQDRLLGELIKSALTRRISIVAAYDPSLPRGGFPASAAGVVAVADELHTFPVGVYGAPGRDIPTTQPGGKWNLVNGSSYAAAHVSGLIALAREHNRPSPALLLVGAQSAGGVVDACTTLSNAAHACSCICPAKAQVALSSR